MNRVPDAARGRGRRRALVSLLKALLPEARPRQGLISIGTNAELYADPLRDTKKGRFDFEGK